MSKQKPGKASLDASAAPKKKGSQWKALRGQRRKMYYAAQFMKTSANKKRRMRRHLRDHPHDAQNIQLYERVKNFGSVPALGLSARGLRRRDGKRKVDAQLLASVQQMAGAS